MERTVYRIIDANFNRAREALRVIEEYCRFALDSESLTGRTKELRHKFCNYIDKIDSGRLIAGRNTVDDVGVGKTVDNQLQRSDLKSCLTAACKRLPEALRAVSEMVGTFEPVLAEQIEKLRYETYTLEKDIVLFSEPAEKFRKVKLYVIITSKFPAEVISLTHKIIAGGADCIQLRAKDRIDDEALFALACEFAGICKAGNVLSIINDRVDIAVAAGADGVHLGQGDLPIEQARKLQTRPLVIGTSTHSMEQLKTACEHNPTYVSTGPVFATSTKPEYEVVGVEYVKRAVELLRNTGIAGVAIGGITLENMNEVLKAGAKKIAICSAITETSDPTESCCKFKEKITTFGID
ncbi:MAG: thiamine phosphate synthase [Planctomycetota bacterium]|jgi:thiamine-phosphate pyrophosphorylase